MKRSHAIIFFVLIGLICCPAKAQKPISERSWSSVATGMPDEWYGSSESKMIAENVLLYQRNIGGWPKNTPFHKPLSDSEKNCHIVRKNQA